MPDGSDRKELSKPTFLNVVAERIFSQINTENHRKILDKNSSEHIRVNL